MKFKKILIGAAAFAYAIIGTNAAQPPLADTETYSVGPNTVLTVTAPGVLANDVDLDGNNLQAVLLKGPVHGALSLSGDGSFIYTPASNYVGFDSYSYKATNGFAESGAAIATIIVGQMTTNTYNFTYANKTALLAAGWDFQARRADTLTARNTERTTGAVVSYDQSQHPGVLRIPVDLGDLWGSTNNTRNSLFRDLPPNWVSFRVDLTFTPTAHHQQANLTLYQDDDNYVEISHAFDQDRGGEVAELTWGDNMFYGPYGAWCGLIVNNASVSTANVRLRIDRDMSSDRVTGFYSTDGINWISLGGVSQVFSNPRLAIWAGGSPGGFPNCDIRRVDVISGSADVTSALVAQPSHLVFHAVAGEQCTAIQQLRVVPLRAPGYLGWTLSNSCPWLATSATDGTAPGTCDVSVDTTGLAPGIYEAPLLLQSDSASSAVTTVTLIVNPTVRARVATWQGAKTGVMSFTIDDSELTAFDDLTSNHVAGTYMLWCLAPVPAQFTDYYNAGMELGGHSVNHLSSELDVPTQRYEMETNILGVTVSTPQPQAKMVSYAWPWGIANVSQRVVGADYFLSARGFHENLLEDPTPYDFMYLKCFNSHQYYAPDYNPSAPPNPSDYKNTVDDAITQGKWFILGLHSTNDSDGCVSYAVTKDIWVAPQGSVVKYILQRDRTVISNFVESASMVQFDTYRLPLDASAKRSFETAIGAQDVVTFQMDLTGLPSITGVLVNGAPVTYTNKGGTLVFSTMITPTPERVQIVTSKPILTVTADSKSRKYGQTNPVFTGTLAGMQSGDSITATYTTVAVATNAVGTYSITPVLNDPNSKLGNYTVVTNNGILTVTQALLTVSITASNKVYDGTNTASVTFADNRLSGDIFTINYTNSTFANRNAGTNKVVTVSGLTISGGAAGNYALTSTSASATGNISARAITVTALTDSKTYDGGTNSTKQPTITLGSLVSSDTGSFTQTFNNKTSGANKTLIPSGLVNDGNSGLNYSVTWSNDLTGSVLTRPLTVTATGQNKVYDGTNTAVVTLSDNRVGGDILTNFYASAVFTDGNVGTVKSIAVTGIGIGGIDSGNYSFNTNASASADITAASLVVTANNKSRVYGATDPILTATITGFVSGETNSAISGNPGLTNLATALSPIGSYPISATLGTLAATNYVFSFVPGTLTVNPAALTGAADNKSRFYGQTNPVFTATYSGFVNGESAAIITGTLSGSTTAQTNSPVSSYPISVTGQSAVNYAINYIDGVLSVLPAPLVVKANDATRAYGQTNPVFAASITGWANGEDTNALTGSLALSTTAATNSPVGSYDIIPSGLASTNYSITFSNGTLTVTAYALAVVADSQSRTYGATNPVLTGTLTGVQNGDNISATFTTAATTNSAVGAYSIAPTLLDPNNKLVNYSLSSTNGALTVNPAALTGAADNKIRFYGQTNPVFTATYSGFVNGESAAIITGTLSGSTTAQTNSPVGSYPLSVAGQSATNYAINYIDGVLSVLPAPLVVKANDATRAYGQTNPAFTATITGWANGENTNALTGSLALSATANTNSPVGTYAIIPSGFTSTNYAIVFSNGTFTVTMASSKIVLISTKNPSIQTSNVTFMASLSLTGPAIPTGAVQFSTNGVAFGDPVPLSAGTAGIDIVFYNAGSNTVSAVYLGDGNYQGSTNSLVQVIALNLEWPSALSIQDNKDGTVTVFFSGTPAGSYLVKASMDLMAGNSWSIISTNVAGVDGKWSYTESMTNSPQRFYQATKP